MTKNRDEEVLHDWELFALLPKGSIQELASRLGLSRSTVERWFREPASDENPYGTGENNPLQRLKIIFDYAHFAAPEFQVELIEYFLTRLEQGNGQREETAKQLRARLDHVKTGGEEYDKAS
jgi:transposase-like protein